MAFCGKEIITWFFSIDFIKNQNLNEWIYKKQIQGQEKNGSACLPYVDGLKFVLVNGWNVKEPQYTENPRLGLEERLSS